MRDPITWVPQVGARGKRLVLAGVEVRLVFVYAPNLG